jgi:hypothetical protein
VSYYCRREKRWSSPLVRLLPPPLSPNENLRFCSLLLSSVFLSSQAALKTDTVADFVSYLRTLSSLLGVISGACFLIACLLACWFFCFGCSRFGWWCCGWARARVCVAGCWSEDRGKIGGAFAGEWARRRQMVVGCSAVSAAAAVVVCESCEVWPL